MTIKRTLSGYDDQKVDVHIWTDNVEQLAEQQLINVAKMPFVFHHVAAMPDVHAGKGATIGSVIATKGAIIPTAVGLDGGCGMLAVMTSLTKNDLNDQILVQTIDNILNRIPVGTTQRAELSDELNQIANEMRLTLQPILDKHPTMLDNMKLKWENEIGTLGGGNHFIELELDEQDRVWVMIHSGSRGVGNHIGQYFIKLAKEQCNQHFVELPDLDLAYLVQNTEQFNDYIQAINWAQLYAKVNRKVMLLDVIKALNDVFDKQVYIFDETLVDCHHNYVEKENHFGSDVWVTRKGATRARKNEYGLIPGSMGTCSYLVRGNGEKMSFCSCSHGAGRAMSRRKAVEMFTLDDLIEQTQGVVCKKTKHVLDEIPAAYKNIDEVIDNQSDLVEVVHKFKQVLCIKG